MRLLEALERGVLVGDGANGTCLSHCGYSNQPYDLANLEAPEKVLEVHRAYLDAGSDFIETNTFQSNRLRLGAHQGDARRLNLAGAQLARQAAGDSGIVLGAIGPIGKPMAPIGHTTEEEVFRAIQEQASALVEGGVDGFLLETFIDLTELKVAVEAVKSVSDLPILVSKAFIEDGEMLADGFAGRAGKAMGEMGVAALGANCIVGPQRMLDLVRQMRETTTVPILAFPTPGMPQLVKGSVVYDTDPEYFAKAALRLVEEGASIIGGCCGTTPEHIRKLKQALGNRKAVAKPRGHAAVDASEKAPLAATEPSELAQKIGKKFLVAVEMDVPRGLSLDRLLAGAKALKIAGADVINISDGARARLRMNPAVVSSIIQNRVGIEVTMHFSCRDRNLLAVQSDLLGCHALGLRNILAVTGDPATIGDYPSATSVFDVDAIGLCRILSRFNQGIDLAGYSVGVKCGFTIACAYNPLPLDPAVELDRLKRKKDAGAQLVYTQPVFDKAVVDQIAETCGALELPVLVGVLPLRNARHTEFMHNEVPGISIPEELRQRIMDAPDDQTALEIGIKAACDLGRRIKERTQGIYLMPPFGNHNIARRVMEALG
ncbi:MAG TPA: bifunctional homocysteine S-methyltransferase/methylenetetrahydrofolate reductase [Fimbriimonas sp.]|nr:bifunctional homocysteine S-methyltransferase/methylenetetrahydrofolate reductase [Fimbriimonas sp.]